MARRSRRRDNRRRLLTSPQRSRRNPAGGVTSVLRSLRAVPRLQVRHLAKSTKSSVAPSRRDYRSVQTKRRTPTLRAVKSLRTIPVSDAEVINECVRRIQRREVLFAVGGAGQKSMRPPTYRRRSKVRC